MKIFGGILIAIILYIILSRKTLKQKFIYFLSLTSVLEVAALQGYFIRSGTTELGYEVVCSVLFFIFSLFFAYKKNLTVDKNLFLFSGLFLFTVWLGIILESIYPYDGMIIGLAQGGNWDAYVSGKIEKGPAEVMYTLEFLYYILLLTFVLAMFIVKKLFDVHDILKSLAIMNKFFLILIVYGVIEFIMKNVLGSDLTLQFADIFLGTGGSTYSELVLRGDSYQLQGLTREPSAYAFQLFMIIIFFMIERNIGLIVAVEKYKKFAKSLQYRVVVSVAVLLMLVSGSFSSLIYLSIVMILCFLIKGKKNNGYKELVYFLIAGFLVCLFLFILYEYFPNSYIGDKLSEFLWAWDFIDAGTWSLLTETGIDIGSMQSIVARVVSIMDTFSDFLNRPILGLGLIVQSAHSGVVSILSDIGLLGLFLWIKMVFYRRSETLKYDYVFIIFALFIANIPAGLRIILYGNFVILLIESTRYYKKE